MTARKDWAGKYGPTIDGLIAAFAIVGVLCWIVCR